MPSAQALLSDPASVGIWNVDPTRSTIGFQAKSTWGLTRVDGRFTKFHGEGQIADDKTVSGRIDIHSASLDTKLGMRDKHLRSAEYFDTERFPDISVVVTGAKAMERDIVELRAQLTVKGTTASLPLRATVGMAEGGAARLSTQTTVDRKDFGVHGNLIGMLPDKVTIFGDVVFRRAR